MSTKMLTVTTPGPQFDKGGAPTDRPPTQGALPVELEMLARWLDSAFRIPGIGVRFGFDALLGLLPGVGDATTSIASLYILSAAHRYKVSRVTLTRMALNIVLETIIGAVPLLGDLFDVYWKSNQRNVELLRRHLAAPPAEARQLQRSDRWFVVALMVGLVALMIGAAIAAYWILSWVVAAFYRAIA
jgi:hypothetical protein